MAITWGGRGERSWGWVTIVLLTAPIWVACSVAYLGISGLLRLGLHVTTWGRQSSWVVFVYSDSPRWKEHIEREVIPRLPAWAVVLNSSHRGEWRWWNLAMMLFRTFAGNREHTPIALVFRRFRWVRAFRFYGAFVEAKRGRGEPLREIERKMFEELGDCK